MSEAELMKKLSNSEVELKKSVAYIKSVYSITDFYSKCYQIRRKLQNWSHLLKKFVMENFIFLCSVWTRNFLNHVCLIISHTSRLQNYIKSCLLFIVVSSSN